jgi:hypothetical protein
MVTIFSVFVAERHEVTIDKRRSRDRADDSTLHDKAGPASSDSRVARGAVSQIERDDEPQSGPRFPKRETSDMVPCLLRVNDLQQGF